MCTVNSNLRLSMCMLLISISMAINFGVFELIFHRYVHCSSVPRPNSFPINWNVPMHAFSIIPNQLHVFTLCAPAKSMTTSWKDVFPLEFFFLMRRNKRKLNVDAQMHERLKIETDPCETKENPKKRFSSSLLDYVLFDYATHTPTHIRTVCVCFNLRFTPLLLSSVRQCADRCHCSSIKCEYLRDCFGFAPTIAS